MAACDVLFAPLQGYTDAVYREAHHHVFGGVSMYYTPFVRLEKGGFRAKELRDVARSEQYLAPLTPQLIAATSAEFRMIASLFVEQGYERADLNLGCPFPMQARLHRGAGILPYKEEAVELLNTIREFSTLRFSVKLRLGWERPDECMALLPLLNRLPLSHVTLHPRVGVQQYKGSVDQEAFALFQSACGHPLFYNGDLASLDDIEGVTIRFPELQGVMMGRGLLAHPWLAVEYQTGKELTDRERREKLMAFHQLLVEGYSARLEGGAHQILTKLQTVWDYFLPDAEKHLRKKVLKSSNLNTYETAVCNLIGNYHLVVGIESF
ncbi:MAG: tRNA-dihydrouridine synthase family protein [Tannerellaceae bacterium]